MSDRAAAFARDVAAIPEVYERLADGGGVAPAIRDVLGRSPRRPQRIVLTGLGSSRFAALAVEGRLRAGGAEVVIEPATADVPVDPRAGSVCIAISSSGRTPEVVAAAERHRGTCPVLAVTRDGASPLAGAADAVALLGVDAEESGIATTSYAATLAVLLHLTAALGRAVAPQQELAEAARAAREAIASRGAWLPPALVALRGVESVWVLAPWSERGQAEQVALLFREGPRRSAEVAETAEWLHTGLYTALPGSAALVLTGSPADDEVQRTIEGRSGRVLAVHEHGNAGSWPVAASIPGPAGLARIVAPALLAAELWQALTGG